GGFAKWKAEKRPTKSGVEQRPFRPVSGTPQRDMTIDVNGVEQLTTRSAWRLVGARAPERYRGEAQRLDKQAGHIPRAESDFFQARTNCIPDLSPRGSTRVVSQWCRGSAPMRLRPSASPSRC